MIKYILLLWSIPFLVFAKTPESECKIFTDVAKKMWEYKQTIPKQVAVKQTLMEAVKSEWSTYEVLMIVDLIEFVYTTQGSQKEITNKYEYHCNIMLTPSTEM